MGERLWINRQQIPVPQHHKYVPNVLNVLAFMGLVCWVWGLWTLSMWPTVFGIVIMYLAKLWFLDRMVWLFNEMAADVPEYARWLYEDKKKR